MSNGSDEIKPPSGLPGPQLGRIRIWRTRIDVHEITESELELLAVTSENTNLDLTLWSICAGVLPTAIAALYTELTPPARLGFQTAALVAVIIGLTSLIRWIKTRNSVRSMIDEIKKRKT